jgi:hypothetical protein
MKKRILPTLLLLLLALPALAQSNGDKQQVLAVVQGFFDALEQQDTLAFRRMFVPGGSLYSLSDRPDSVRVGSTSPFSFKFNPSRIVREKMRPAEVVVQLQRRMAMVWAPYDLWINDRFSHCGTDVFTLLKTPTGWRIASLAYTMETDGCGSP